MKNLSKMGGLAAIGCGLTYVIGFAFLVTVLAPFGAGSDGKDYGAMIAFTADNHTVLAAWNMIIYVVNGVLLAILAVALSSHLRAATPGLAQVSLLFGGLWATLVIAAGMVANVGLKEALSVYATDPARAAELFQIFSTVENGLGGGNEIAGGVWILSLSIAGLISAKLSKPLSGLGIVIGASGLASAIPALSEVLGAVFGLGFIVWFFWAGIALLRSKPEAA